MCFCIAFGVGGTSGFSTGLAFSDLKSIYYDDGVRKSGKRYQAGKICDLNKVWRSVDSIPKYLLHVLINWSGEE